MSFVQVEFLWLFGITSALYWALSRRGQNVLLLVASAVFYGWVHPGFLALLWATATLDWACALGIERAPSRRRTWLAVSLASNLGVLGVFKYLGWFLENVDEVLGVVGLGGLPTLRWILPAGISFYTFQALSYVVDVYRGRERARTSWVDVLVFVSFFPQLVAGPIERAGSLLAQVEQPRRFAWEDQREGLALALWGAFQKIVVADQLAPWVDRVYAHPDPSWGMVWAGTLAFSVQILADFSGYTDIARGTARMLGIRLSPNFLHPYLAATPTEVWNRYHRSFTSWLTDYVYYPLASARWVRRWVRPPFAQVRGEAHVWRVTFLTFLVSGLWHGAGWHFVLWGAFLGALQVAYLAGRRRLPAGLRDDASWRLVTVPVMFGWQLVALMLFRTPSVERIAHQLTLAPWDGTPAQAMVATATVAVALAFATPLLAALVVDLLVWPRVAGSPAIWPLRTAWWTVEAWAVWLAGRPTLTDFVYFRF